MILWFNEILQTENKLGDIANILALLYNKQYPIQKGFCLSSLALNYFLEQNNIKEEVKRILDEDDITKLEKIKQLFLQKEFPYDLRNKISDIYNSFNVNPDVFKVVPKQALEIIKAGRENLDLNIKTSPKTKKFRNVKGIDELIRIIKICWAEIISKLNSFDDPNFSIILQKATKTEKSAIIHEKGNKIRIKACIGIINSEIKKDEYIINKETLETENKGIINQEKIIKRDENLGKDVIRIINNQLQKLNEQEILNISRTFKEIKNLINKPLELKIEFENNKFFIEDIIFLEERSTEEMNIEEKKEELMNTYETVTEVKVFIEDFDNSSLKYSSIGLLKLNLEINENLKENLYNSLKTNVKNPNNSVWFRLLDFNFLDGIKEENPLLGYRGIRIYNEKPELLKVQFEAIKKLHDEGFTNIGIVIPYITTIEELIKIKELIKEVGLEPLEEIEVGILADTPASIQILYELCDEGIDFVVIDVEKLTQLTLAVDKNNHRLNYLYNETHPAVLKQIADALKNCRNQNVETSIYYNYEKNPGLVDFLIKQGIDSIISKPSSLSKLRYSIAKAEKKLLLRAVRNNLKKD